MSIYGWGQISPEFEQIAGDEGQTEYVCRIAIGPEERVEGLGRASNMKAARQEACRTLLKARISFASFFFSFFFAASRTAILDGTTAILVAFFYVHIFFYAEYLKEKKLSTRTHERMFDSATRASINPTMTLIGNNQIAAIPSLVVMPINSSICTPLCQYILSMMSPERCPRLER